MMTEPNAEPNVIFATVRESISDEIPIECRFDDGQKFAAVVVAAGHERLAGRIADFLLDTDDGEVSRLRAELTAIANAAVDGLMINHVFHPHKLGEPLALRDTPYTREELGDLRAPAEHGAEEGFARAWIPFFEFPFDVERIEYASNHHNFRVQALQAINALPALLATIDALRERHFRLLATVAQRDRIYAAIQTDADPAGTYRELVEARDVIRALEAKVREMGDGS